MALRSFYQKTIVRTAFFFTVLFFCSYLIPNNLTLRSSSSRYPISFKDDPIRWSNASQSRQPNPHFTAAYVTLTKSDAESLGNLRKTIRNLEDTVNRERGYPYIIFCSEPLSQDSRDLVRALTRADVEFYDLDSTMYGYSDNIDLDKAAETRRRMSDVIFGDDENYRFASRFMAGVIFRHPALQHIDYYWRFETGTEYVCPLDFDPFQYMYDHQKKLSFSMALYEYEETIPTLFTTIMEFANNNSDLVQSMSNKNSLWHFIIDSETKVFNKCHFWSNFQIADLNFFRGEAYQAYFDHIEQAGGIFYERWGDPIIQSLGAVLLLEKNDVHFWDNIGYRVADYFTHCPSDKALYKKCSCRPEQNFDFDGYSCLRYF
ncbi:hypothetical protein LRAMOSA10948 [Lichtheimia ramosa]|uniref:Alpha 1,2-mannosyltransferase n=1 Tax=Lichtheimia ramosa TaxID=688394 RepID=A0A077WR71_9FUNG|nr:hypothetical protein LRAMOSA10948 [Lichtheimia ramosa]